MSRVIGSHSVRGVGSDGCDSDEEGSADVTTGRLMKMFQVCVQNTIHAMESPHIHKLSASFEH